MSGSTWVELGVDDPAPGDERAVGDLARTLRLWGEEAADQERDVRRLRASLTSGPWTGEAAEAFVARLEPLPDRLGTVSTSFLRAAEALRVFAGHLAAAKDDAARLTSRVGKTFDDIVVARADARRRLALAQAEVGVDPLLIESDVLRQHGLRESWHRGEGLRTSQFNGSVVTTAAWDASLDRLDNDRADAVSLREQVETHARAAAGVLADATTSAFGYDDSWLGAALDAIGIDEIWHVAEFAGDYLGWVSTICGVLALVTVWFPPLSGAIATTALVAGSGAMLCTAAQVAASKEQPSELAWDALGVATGGLGRVLATGTRAIRTSDGLRSAATTVFDDMVSSGLPRALSPQGIAVRATARDVPVVARPAASPRAITDAADVPTDRELLLATAGVMTSTTTTTVDAGLKARDVRDWRRKPTASPC